MTSEGGKDYSFIMEPLNETRRIDQGDWRWEREAKVLAGILLDPRLLDQCRDRLSRESFMIPVCQAVWKAILALVDAGEPVDPLEVARWLEVHGELSGVGGWAEVRQVADAFGVSICFDQYVEKLVRLHRRRVLQAGLEEASLAVRSAKTDDVIGVIESVRDQLDTASAAVTERAEFRSFGDLASEQIVAVINGKGAERIIPTGFRAIDNVISGLSPIYSICAAYPGMGKTTFMVNLALNLSLAGRRVLYISLEDPKELIIERALSRLSGILYSHIQRKRVPPEEHSELLGAESKMHGLPLIIENLAGANVARIRSLVFQYRERFGDPAAVIIDHLGKIREKGSSLYERTSEASGKLADLQLELGCSLIALCQLARRKDKGSVSLPKMDDLRDSGWLEADARQVWLLHRPKYYADQGMAVGDVDANECQLVSLKYPRPAVIRLYADLTHAYIGDGPMGYEEQEGY